LLSALVFNVWQLQAFGDEASAAADLQAQN